MLRGLLPIKLFSIVASFYFEVIQVHEKI